MQDGAGATCRCEPANVEAQLRYPGYSFYGLVWSGHAWMKPLCIAKRVTVAVNFKACHSSSDFRANPDSMAGRLYLMYDVHYLFVGLPEASRYNSVCIPHSSLGAIPYIENPLVPYLEFT